VPATFSTSEKPATEKKKRDQSRSRNQPKFTTNGRPGKRTPQLEKALLAAIETGAPYRIACLACGISDDTFTEWRRKDPAFAAQVEKAAGKTALRLLKKIEANAEENFSAAAWILERRFPTDFSRPEVQLNLIQQANINTHGADGHNLESIIVSDLEFLGLKKHENYAHHPAERPAREVEATVSSVPEDLSGVLKVVNHPASAVISESQARESRRRVEQTNAKIDALLKAKRLGNGNGTPEPVAMKLAPITMPAEPVPSSWWAQLVTGDNTRQIARDAAVMVCRTVVREVLGGNRAQPVPIEFAPGEVLLRDVHSAVLALCGAPGWTALVKRGEG
jgi:hypothetical protein